ncbi:hypothetical protein BGX34_001586 [Mortierella sp. NVP85]|nr:hypothetical protein BGX34_001586 [Mortierella sp. NVP85]
MSYPLRNGRIPHVHGDVAIRSGRVLPVAEGPEAYELGSGRRNPKVREYAGRVLPVAKDPEAYELGSGRRNPKVGEYAGRVLPVAKDPEAYELGSGRRHPKAVEYESDRTLPAGGSGGIGDEKGVI